MKLIDEKTVSKVSDLIKIKVQPEELGKYADQLNKVLDAVEVLKELKTDEVTPSYQTHGLQNVLRDDEKVTPGLDMSKYKNTANFKHGYFVVDKVI